MKVNHCLILLILLVLVRVSSAQTIEPPSPAQMKSWSLEQRAQYLASTLVAGLPNFIVTQYVTREARTVDTLQWVKLDTVEIELTHRQSSGDVQKVIKTNGKPAKEPERIKTSGAMSVGEFGNILAMLNRAEFGKMVEEKLNGRATRVYEFSLKKEIVGYSLSEYVSKQQTKTAVAGRVWIDLETAYILRLEYEAIDIPKDFPLTVSEHVIEYGEIKVDGNSYFLPVRSESLIGSEKTNIYHRNQNEFRNYRIFKTEVKVLTDDEVKPQKTKSKP